MMAVRQKFRNILKYYKINNQCLKWDGCFSRKKEKYSMKNKCVYLGYK